MSGTDSLRLLSSFLDIVFHLIQNFERDRPMPKYVTIGYGDEAGYERTAPQVRAAAHEHDHTLAQSGSLIGMAGSPVQVRNPDDSGVETLSAAFMSSALPIAGFAIIEAANLDEAIELVSKSPCAVAHGVVEIWPLESAPKTTSQIVDLSA